MVMKIVLVSTGVLPVPCPGYGGLEMVVADLAIALDKLGHEVHVIAPSESKIGTIGNIKLIDCGTCNPNSVEWEQKAFEKCRPMMDSEEFKGAVWHDHSWRKFFYIAKMQNPSYNVCSTLHGMLPYATPPKVAYPSMIGISKDHADRISAGLGIPCRVAYNGIDLTKYALNSGERSNRYLFLARITTFKGPHVFVDAMKQIGGEGDVVGDDTLVEDKGYVERVLMACNSYPAVRYWGGVSRDRAIEFFQRAKCYVLPNSIDWQEPFGLTVIEAQACGCPVVATASGAVPELIEEGKTGYVVKNVSDVAGVLLGDKVAAIKASDCRANAERFSRENMALRYVELYNEVLEKGGW